MPSLLLLWLIYLAEEPVGRDGGEVEDEVVIDKLVGTFNEALLLLKRSYCTATCDRLTEMNVDR